MFHSVVLIDDDILVREHWERRFRSSSSKLSTYASRDEFQRSRHRVLKSSGVFVDQYLGDGSPGIELAHELYRSGFTHVFMCTEVPDQAFAGHAWLSGVVGKTPPSWLHSDDWTKPVTSGEREYYVSAMTGDETERYQRRIGEFLGVLYGGESVGYASLSADGFSLPEEVMNAWERGIVRSLSDDDIKIQTDKAWRSLNGARG